MKESDKSKVIEEAGRQAGITLALAFVMCELETHIETEIEYGDGTRFKLRFEKFPSK